MSSNNLSLYLLHLPLSHDLHPSFFLIIVLLLSALLFHVQQQPLPRPLPLTRLPLLSILPFFSSSTLKFLACSIDFFVTGTGGAAFCRRLFQVNIEVNFIVLRPGAREVRRSEKVRPAVWRRGRGQRLKHRSGTGIGGKEGNWRLGGSVEKGMCVWWVA